MKLSKNDIITLTRGELDAMIETAVNERLLYKSRKRSLINLLTEDYGADDDYDREERFNISSEDDSFTDFAKLDKLIDMYEDGRLADADDDYTMNHYIRHYRRGDNDIVLQDFYDELKNLYDKCHTNKNVTPHNIDRKIEHLIDIYEDEIEEDSDDYGISRQIYYYNNGDKRYSSFNKKLELYNDLRTVILNNI